MSNSYSPAMLLRKARRLITPQPNRTIPASRNVAGSGVAGGRRVEGHVAELHGLEETRASETGRKVSKRLLV
jgi:hypothetical protein